MPIDSTTPASSSLASAFFSLLAPYRRIVAQERVFVRLAHLSVLNVVSLGRRTISQLLVTMGIGADDWTAWHRLFNQERFPVDSAQALLVEQLLESIPASERVFAAGVDATQLPRTTKSMPGCGFTRNPKGPKWMPSLHLAQRYVGISALFPRTPAGDSRAVPLRLSLLRTAKTTAMGDCPELKEGQGGVNLIRWLREQLDTNGRAQQPLLVVADGSYSTAPVLSQLPERTTLVARVARNRALYGLPIKRAHGKGRQPSYGAHGPTPVETLHATTDWTPCSFMVRGREVTPQATMTGPWLVKGAPHQPVMLVVVRGVDHGEGKRRRQRDPQYFLVSMQRDAADAWTVGLSLAEVLAWAWQRWELEISHRELKSTFGVGEQQAFSDLGAATVIPWIVWVYALVVLAGYRTWGLGPGTEPDLGRWYTARRWSFSRLLQGMRKELWQAAEFQPVWQRSPDKWAEITSWIGTQTNAAVGSRRL